MKKYFTLKNLFIIAGALLVIVGFFVALGSGLHYADSTGQIDTIGLVIGKQTTIIKAAGATLEVVIPKDEAVWSGLSMAGVIIMLVGGVAAVAVTLVMPKMKFKKFVVLGIAGLIIIGAILAFLVKSGYAISSHAKDSSMTIEDTMESLKDYKLNAAAVISPILGILGAGSIGASQFIRD